MSEGAVTKTGNEWRLIDTDPWMRESLPRDVREMVPAKDSVARFSRAGCPRRGECGRSYVLGDADCRASALCRLTIAWLHVEGRDFDYAVKEAEASLSQALEANPFSFFIRRIVLVKAYLGRHDIKLAREQIVAMEEREADGVAMETPIVSHYILAQYDCCFESGDLNGALRDAERLHEWAAGAPDRQFLAFALEALARVEAACRKHTAAAAHLTEAIWLVRKGHFPLPARRIYAAAADVFEGRGRKCAARAWRIRGQEVIRSLANSLETDDPLRAIFAADDVSPPDRLVQSGNSEMPLGSTRGR